MKLKGERAYFYMVREVTITSLERKQLGELLVNTGLITKEQLEEALKIQSNSGGRLGQILVQLGYIDEEVLIAFLGKQFGVPYIALSEYGEINEEVARLIPESIARRELVIPIAREGRVLTVAMVDPLNVFLIDEIKMMTGYEVKAVISSERDIRDTIEKIFGPKEKIEEVIKEAVRETEGVEVVKEVSEEASVVELEAAAEEAPVVKMVNLILNNAIKSRASDIHIEPFEKNVRVRYRIDGVLHEQPSLPKKFQNAIVSRIKIMSQLDISEHRLPQDGRIKIRTMGKEVDFRVSTIPTIYGEKVVLRILDPSSLCLDLTKLGFEPEALALYQRNIQKPYGMILITGPTGSGKSTTLYSTLSTLNYPDKNIVTIEDPVEYVLEGINQVQVRPEIKFTFAAGLRAFLRQDPNIIMVGEIRDQETASIAINAALTGHLVFATLHTNDAPSALTRLNNMGIEPFLTTSSVILIVAQRLVRIICEKCKENYSVPAELLVELGVPREELKDVKEITLYRGGGCDNCSNTGYRGRKGIYEVLEMNDEIRELVLEHATTQAIKQVARKYGMMTLREAALRKLLRGETTIEEVLRVTAADIEPSSS
jgi:type IV pilus assembly protein PilB